MNEFNGGYDDGYAAVDTLWGLKPGRLVERLIQSTALTGRKVLDVGAGEGKNAAALVAAGAAVDALECSPLAIDNGRRLFPSIKINWIRGDIRQYSIEPSAYDVIVCYGSLHCLPNEDAIIDVVTRTMCGLKSGGIYIAVAFNDGSQDLSAHPGFNPTLCTHRFYLQLFGGWTINFQSDELLFETHPHNMIPHYHSITRIMATKP